jgi:hypothetical protein
LITECSRPEEKFLKSLLFTKLGKARSKLVLKFRTALELLSGRETHLAEKIEEVIFQPQSPREVGLCVSLTCLLCLGGLFVFCCGPDTCSEPFTSPQELGLPSHLSTSVSLCLKVTRFCTWLFPRAHQGEGERECRAIWPWATLSSGEIP